MKIFIVTMPLLNNYGGLLQNYALQKILIKLGHQVETIDFIRNPSSSFLRCVLSWTKSLIIYFIPSKRKPFAKLRNVGVRMNFSNSFIKKNINVSQTTIRYSKKMIKGNSELAVIVGSDQVWRPKYNYCIENMYLNFIKKYSIKRIAYAASFGLNDWEYTPKQTKVCSKLAYKFNAISVREESGVKLCKEHLGVDATWVLDPTLLLTKEDYFPICKDIPVCKEKYLAVYVLDENEEVTAMYEKEAAARGLVVKKFYAGAKSTLSVPEWLAMFRDASYVVTDSFHGTVFSIIFGKEFKCVYNKSRGAARFESLLELYNSGKLEEKRVFSLNWLKRALES